MKEKVQIKNKKLKKRLIIIPSSIITTFLCILLLLFYGPWSGFRNFWITTSMTTMSHQYLATTFYKDKTIKKVLEENKITENKNTTNPDLIRLKKYATNIKIFKNRYEKEILTKDKNNTLYKLIPINGKGYKGFLVALYDPSKIKIATSKYLGKKGENILIISKREKALIAMNAGGFYDPNWDSNGAIPHGTVIKNGKIVSDFKDAGMGGGFIGFTKDNKLLLGKMSKEEALKKGYRDAIEFGPFLIINGKSSFIKGNGGWGIAPRTAIGQRKDGIVLLLVINGRLPESIGADMTDLTEIMKNYGAYNAANLDGGSSSELVIKNKIINTPVAGGDKGLRDMSTFFVVKE